MARFKIELKQHTPIIHFQAEQSGAILRATEVKPKLDKFLKKCVFGEKENDYNKFLIGDTNAFDYKLRIIINAENIETKEIEEKGKNGKKKNFPNYFGNLGKKENDKLNKFVFCESLELDFFSFHNELLEKIKEILPLFLMKHNFGQRQSKGFGSFFINDKNNFFRDGKKLEYDKNKIEKIKKLDYCLEVPFKNGNCYENAKYVFSKIEKIYIKIRRGSKNVEPYIKRYSDKNNITWDKEVIKDTYIKGLNEKVWTNAHLMKDLLGLSTREEWGNKIITKENDNIERFQSSIFFKPLKVDNKYIIYFEGRKIDDRYLNKEFKIKCDDKGDLVLSTPLKFDIQDFLEYINENENDIKKVGDIDERR